VPEQWAREFAQELRNASTQPVAYAELPGAQHTFDLVHSFRCDLVVDRIEAFTSWVLREPRGRDR
jgi:acetyl esterase/lipase